MSDKEIYPTFARTTPTDKQTVSAVFHILRHFNWSIVSIISADEAQRKTVVSGLEETLRAANITIQRTIFYKHPCFAVFYGGDDASCKFGDILDETAPITRSKYMYILLL